MVPDGWSEEKLRNIAKIKSGATPLRSKGELYFSENGTPWIKTLDLNNAEIVKVDEKITDLALRETSCSIFPKGTVLVAMYGGFNQIGRTGLITSPSAINQALSGLILDAQQADSRYVLNYLNNNRMEWKRFAASSRKDPNITREDVCGFNILLPPIEEQKKISEVISVWDKAITTTEHLLANSHKQKKALVQRLLTANQRFPGFDGDINKVRLDEVVDEFIVPMRDKPKKLDGDVPWCRIEDFSGKYLFKSKSDQGVDRSTIKSMNLKVFPSGTLLVSCSADLGRCAIVGNPLVTNQTFIGLVPNKDFLDVEYFYYFMIASAHRLNALSSGTTISYLSRKEFERLKIDLPSMGEQTKIASVLSCADKDIDVLRQRLNYLKLEKKALMQQLLTGRRRVKLN